ncbi:MAG: 5-(carboxyamino)imidazole ribonucleotide synthase [Pseudomonadota bacterium]
MKIGIVGGGQLARMMVLAGYPLGMEFLVLDPNERASAGQVAPLLPGNFGDVERLRLLAERVDVVTFDLENVPAPVLRSVAAPRLFPPVDALDTCQDRLNEKTLFDQLDIEVAGYRPVNELDELLDAVHALGLPLVLKTRRLGYDGRGQRVLRETADIEPAWQALRGVPLLAEQFVPFDGEVSIVGVRSEAGEIRSYPLSWNVHRDGILRTSIAPAAVSEALARSAQEQLHRVMTHFNYVGVLTIEYFVVGERLLANEMAPRVHNSGHWTIEGATTSQFENHLRAVAGLPLGGVDIRRPSAMINFIATMPAPQKVLAVPGAHLHDYGKSARAGRKLGHCTVTGQDEAERDARLAMVQALVDDAG